MADANLLCKKKFLLNRRPFSSYKSGKCWTCKKTPDEARVKWCHVFDSFSERSLVSFNEVLDTTLNFIVFWLVVKPRLVFSVLWFTNLSGNFILISVFRTIDLCNKKPREKHSRWRVVFSLFKYIFSNNFSFILRVEYSSRPSDFSRC